MLRAKREAINIIFCWILLMYKPTNYPTRDHYTVDMIKFK